MSEWITTVNKIIKENTLSQSQKIALEGKKIVSSTPTTPLEVVEAVTGWFGTYLTEYTEGSSEGAARRTVWLYDNGWMLVIGDGMYPLITHLTDELNTSSQIPIKVTKSQWVFEKSTNGWEWWQHNASPEEILALINALSKKFGEPKLLLPLGYKMNQVEDESEKEYLEYFHRDTDAYKLSKAFYHLLTFINKGEFAKISPWEVMVIGEDDYMPYHCDYNRFFRMTDELVDKDWLVIIDEHCAACASGTRQVEKEQNPKLKHAPEFLTWGQNSQTSWMPDGKIFFQQWLDDEDEIKQLIEISSKHGLDIDDNLIYESS